MFPFFETNILKRKKMEIDYYLGPMFCLVSYNHKSSEYFCIQKYQIYAVIGAMYLFILVCLIIDILKCLKNCYKLIMS